MEQYSRAQIEAIEFEDDDIITATGEVDECSCNIGIGFGGPIGGGGGGR